jgi:hypothetical protein
MDWTAMDWTAMDWTAMECFRYELENSLFSNSFSQIQILADRTHVTLGLLKV